MSQNLNDPGYSPETTPAAISDLDRNGALVFGSLATGARVYAVRKESGWGIVVEGPGLSSVVQPRPVRVEVLGEDGEIRKHAYGYGSLKNEGDVFLGKAELEVSSSATLAIEDRWSLSGSVLGLSRTLEVSGEARGGFLSSITLTSGAELLWTDVEPFAPGMIYGSAGRLSAPAIGSRDNYLTGVRQVRIREDRLPAPLFGLHFSDGTSVAVLDADPGGSTTAADSHDMEATTLVDERFRFAAVGAYEHDGRVSLGLWFPGTEGEVTYRGDTFPDGQMRRWRRRYHPIKDGSKSRYRAAFRFGRDESFPDFCRNVWRWTWEVLQPRVTQQDIELSRKTLVEMLSERAIRASDGKTGIPHFYNAASGEVFTFGDEPPDTLMGFTGRGIASAYFLLREAEKGGEKGERYRELGVSILDSFATIPMSPPAAEGFDLIDGGLRYQKPYGVSETERIYLRSVCEGGKYMLLAWQRETDKRPRPRRLVQLQPATRRLAARRAAPGRRFPPHLDGGYGRGRRRLARVLLQRRPAPDPALRSHRRAALPRRGPESR